MRNWRLRLAWWLLGSRDTGDWMKDGRTIACDKLNNLQELELVLLSVRHLINSNLQLKALIPIDLEIAINRTISWPLSIRAGEWSAYFDKDDDGTTHLFLHGPTTKGSIGLEPELLALLIRQELDRLWKIVSAT